MTAKTCAEFYSVETNLRNLGDYLVSNIRTRSAIEHEKRVFYFKGKRFMEVMLDAHGWPKNLMQPKFEKEAIEIGTLLLVKHYFHQSERFDDKRFTEAEKKNHLRISAVTSQVLFNPTAYFTWMYQGSVIKSRIKSGLIVAVIFLIILFPVWPLSVRKIIWYISVTLLLALIGFLVVRMVAYVLLWVFGYEFWIFPRLFDENASPTESFSPIISFEKAASGTGYFRVAILIVLIGTGVYAARQPAENIAYVIDAQKKLVDDLYEGKLMANNAAMQAPAKIYPSISELLKEEEELLRLEREEEEERRRQEQEDADDKLDASHVDDVLDAMLEEEMNEQEME